MEKKAAGHHFVVLLQVLCYSHFVLEIFSTNETMHCIKCFFLHGRSYVSSCNCHDCGISFLDKKGHGETH